ncbi:uncharacterized protein zgc:113276 [Osmerus mordax]|uniref:uncharacterized protein zgc:113276 n=1 Tax=Osmerus mordax TaxID=8014 RepID=UPI0035101C92
MLDVLIIGGGPHALTLATLLSNPHHPPSDPSPPRPDPQPGQNVPRRGLSKSRGRTKRRVPSRSAEQLSSTEWVLDSAHGPPCPPSPPGPPLSLRVVDSYGEWAALWESQFTALNIPHLRSHTLVHTDPFDKAALRQFVAEQGRGEELHSLPDRAYILDQHTFFNDSRLGRKEKQRLGLNARPQDRLCFSLPGAQLSVDFFRQQVERYDLNKVLLRGTVERIVPEMEDKRRKEEEEEEGKEEGTKEQDEIEEEEETTEEVERSREEKEVKFFRVHLRGGTVLEARRVVMATGPTRSQMANIPSWVSAIQESYPEDRLRHTVTLMHPTCSRTQETGSKGEDERLLSLEACVVCEPGERVMVIGGGLTSAHIVSTALSLGASHVAWVMRKHLQLKQFDVGDVESLVGRYSHVEHGIKLDGRAYLRQFYNQSSLHKRLAMIRQARKGGAVTPEAYAHLQPFIQSGRVSVRAYCQVSEARWSYRAQAWSVALTPEGDSWAGDRIWLATGCKLDVQQDPLLSHVIKDFPIQVIDGWPCIGESLCWSPGCPLYLMGQYTALQVGPHAVNLAGGQAASMRIAKDILGNPEVAAEKTRTEEYVQHMHGLMWL